MEFGGAAVAWPLRARAQKIPKVGFLVAGDPETTWTLFRKAMTELGYEEKRTVVHEFRAAASGSLDRYARELVGLPVDVIVTVLSPATAAAQKVTSTVPIVFNCGAITLGLVDNMARPEGNMTGAFGPSSVVAVKGVQLFHEMKPDTRSVGLLLNESDSFHVPLQRDTEAAARAEGIEPVATPVRSPSELLPAFEALPRRGIDGVLVRRALVWKQPQHWR